MIAIRSIEQLKLNAGQRYTIQRFFSTTTMYISILFVILLFGQLKSAEYGILCVPNSLNTAAHHHHQQQHQQSGTKGGSINLASERESLSQKQQQQQGNNHRQETRNNSTRAEAQHRPSRSVYMAVDDDKYSRLTSTHNSGDSSAFYPNDQPPVLEQCCACGEAKYELVFEGLWSKYTHPDEFPENFWQAQFSDIIGASHSNEFRMWSQDTLASEGVRELAENGSTKKLESELKQASSKMRTIIKARELHYPTLNNKTSAVFRTDRQHHLVSILSKLAPSPDWMVGVSSLELCQSDCSWATQRVVDLYLWDAGTDSGNSFTAPDQPTRPEEKIHPFRRTVKLNNNNNNAFGSSTQRSNIDTSNNNFNSGLYDSSTMDQQGTQTFNVNYPSSFDSNTATQTTEQYNQASVFTSEQTKPFARVTITRQRIYEKSCNSEPINPSNQMRTQSSLYATTPPSTPTTWPSWSDQSTIRSWDCRFTDWSDWSTCSFSCGRGIRTRTRSFIDEQAQASGCSQVDLIEKEVCISECVGNANCITRDWSDWSGCSVTCGRGYKKRTRSPIGHMSKACEVIKLVELEPCIGQHGLNCTNDPSTCEVTHWSNWSDCSVACGKGTRIRTRQYVRREGLENCSAKLLQKESCSGRPELCEYSPKDHKSSSSNEEKEIYSSNINYSYGSNKLNLPVIDCKLSSWSPWSTCSALCGEGKRTRSRYIIQMPQNGGKACDKKLSRTQKCKNLPPCPPNYNIHHQNPPVTTNTHTQKSIHRSGHKLHNSKNGDWRSPSTTSSTTPSTTTTTTSGSMMDDEDDKEANHVQASQPCTYGNWTQWSDCEVVCQPVKKGSNKELYYCDPDVYC